MGEKRKIWRKGICGIALLCAGLGAFAAKTAAATGFTQEMQVQIGVFDAAEVKLDYEQAEGKYDISAEVRTANLFDALYPFTARYGSRGRLVRSAAENGNGGDVAAELYQTYTKSRNHIRTKRYFMTRQGKRIKEFPPKTKSRIRLP